MHSSDHDKIKGKMINPISDFYDRPSVYCYFRDGYVVYNTTSSNNWWQIYDFLDILILTFLDDYDAYNLVVESNDEYLVVTIGEKITIYSADWNKSQIELIQSDLVSGHHKPKPKIVYTFVLIADYFYALCSFSERPQTCVLKMDYSGNLIEYQHLDTIAWHMVKHDNTVMLYCLRSLSEYTGHLYGGNRGSFFKQRVSRDIKLYKYVYRFIDQNCEEEYTIPSSSIDYHSFRENTMSRYPYYHAVTEQFPNKSNCFDTTGAFEFYRRTSDNNKQQFIWVNKISIMHQFGLIFPKLHTNLPIVYYSDGVVYTFDHKQPVNGLYKFKIPLGLDDKN